ncbi:Auxin response factor 8 [Ananas comosus]|uniref:Auxin response factor n=1 Tax=Ananas comosus TaxID=4615 RepID=A0A199W3W4_ANACO|nr:Auxin response factor 8 [Ananas comosus]
MAAPAGPAAGEPRSVNPQLWMACAGAAARVPAVGRDVYYVPEGHCEQCPRAPDLGGVGYDALVLCRVVGVRYLANPHTDEVFAVIALEPGRLLPPRSAPGGGSAAGGGGGGGRVVSFAKMLTPSDANNGGGFSVPRYCADSIFPRLDMSKDPPVQYLSIRDVHGGRWEFRHIYRGTPRRHLLTTGWSIFVNAKKLVAGDVVVFARNEAKELFVGIRRAYRSFPKPSPATFPHREIEDEPEPENVEGFSRCVKGRVPPSTVVEAVRLAKLGRPFEVMYYPKAGAAEFVVPKEVVDASLMVNWSAGIRVRMPVETEDSSRMTWFQGTVEEIMAKDMGPGTQSPWRMLKIDWDEKEALKDVKKNVKHLKDSSPQNQGSILDSKAEPFKAPASGPREDNEEQVEFSFRLFGQLLKCKRSGEDELDNKYTKEREEVLSLGIVTL